MKKNPAQIQLNNQFLNACSQGNLDLVKDLLNSQESTCHIDFNDEGSQGFRVACQGGYLSVVQYLLTATPLKEDKGIDTTIAAGFRSACETGSLEVVQYLVTVEDKPWNKEDGFFNACRYNHLELVEYLVFGYGIQISEEFRNDLSKKMYSPLILKMFQQRDLNDSLEKILAHKSLISRQFKI